MKLLILTRNVRTYSTRRIAWSCRQAGHEAVVGDPDDFSMRLSKLRPELYVDRRKVEDVAVVLPRFGHALARPGLAVLRQLEQIGIHCVNGTDAMARAKDRLRTLQHLVRHDIDVPPTAYVNRVEDVRFAIDMVGGAPVVVKPLEGTQSRGVMLAETVDSAVSLIEALTGVRHPVVVQKFIDEARGVDLRAYVVGTRVVAAMRVEAPPGEFRASASPDSILESVRLERPYEAAAVDTCRALGLSVAAVDMLQTSTGPMVLEANAAAGLEWFERCCRVDIAGEIVKLAFAQASAGTRSLTA